MTNYSNDNEFLPNHKYIHKFSGSDFAKPNERNLACVGFIDSMNAHRRFDFSSKVSRNFLAVLPAFTIICGMGLVEGII